MAPASVYNYTPNINYRQAELDALDMTGAPTWVANVQLTGQGRMCADRTSVPR